MNNTISPVGSSRILGGAEFDPNTLTPDSLMFYLSTRMRGLDGQITGVFDKQQHSEKVRSALNELQRLVGTLDEETKEGKFPLTQSGQLSFVEQINAQLEVIETLDPDVGNKVTAELYKKGQVMGGGGQVNTGDANYTGQEVKNTTQFLKNVGSDLDNTAQMNMIRLQSLMSSRQTAVQLCTNLIAACADTQKSIVSNYGR
jgi:hypothetical protein